MTDDELEDILNAEMLDVPLSDTPDGEPVVTMRIPIPNQPGWTSEDATEFARYAYQHFQHAETEVTPEEVEWWTGVIDTAKTFELIGSLVRERIAAVIAEHPLIEDKTGETPAKVLAAQQEETARWVEMYVATVMKNVEADPEFRAEVATNVATSVRAWTQMRIYAAVEAEGLQVADLSEDDYSRRFRAAVDAGAGGLAPEAMIRAVEEYSASLTADVARALAANESMRQRLIEIAELVAKLAAETPERPPRKSNRKTELPWADETLFPVANILNQGTRIVGLLVSGAADNWTTDANRNAKMAQMDGKSVGMIDLSSVGGEDEAARIIDALDPRTLKTMVAITRLIFERTKGQPINVPATVTIREVAVAAGYKPSTNRYIDPKILRRLAADLNALTKIQTFAADGPYDPKTKRAPSGWIAPLLNITAIHVEQDGFYGEKLAYEFDAMLGRPYAEAIKERYDVVQIAPAFLQLNPAEDEQAIRLAWYYLTGFRYRMTKATTASLIPIRRLCDDARLKVDTVNLSRFLGRLEGWHKRLHELGVIGDYERVDGPAANAAPRKIFAEGAYRVEPPPAILTAYKEHQARALAREQKARRAPRLPGKTAHVRG